MVALSESIDSGNHLGHVIVGELGVAREGQALFGMTLGMG
jgi:hypothetical protein